MEKIIKEIASKYNEKIRLIQEMFNITLQEKYTIEESTTLINEFLGGVA